MNAHAPAHRAALHTGKLSVLLRLPRVFKLLKLTRLVRLTRLNRVSMIITRRARRVTRAHATVVPTCTCSL